MVTSSASNAVLVKARAMYAKRLKKQNYDDLLSCHSVNDVAAYLKNQPAYSYALSNTGVSSYHRRQLESLVYSCQFSRFASLCRFGKAIGDGMAEYFILRADVDQLIHAVRNLNSLHPGMFTVAMPDYFSSYSHLNNQLNEVYDFNGLLTGVKGTPYEDWFTVFMKDREPDYFEMEQMLSNKLNETARSMVEKFCKGRDRKEALELLDYKFDIENIISVYRLKRMCNPTQQYIRAAVNLDGSLLSEKQWSNLLAAQDEKAVLSLLKGTPYEAFLTDKYEYTEMSGRSMLYEHCRKLLGFSSNSCVVMFCYLFLIENEIKNLNHIIEGIRYSMPIDDIKRLLIGAQNA